MDDADRAARWQAEQNQAALRRRKSEPNIKPQGWCHACGEDAAEGALFCGSGCADEFERMERQRRQRG